MAQSQGRRLRQPPTTARLKTLIAIPPQPRQRSSENEFAVQCDALEIPVRREERAAMADCCDRNLAVDRGGTGPFLSAQPVQPGCGDMIEPVERQQGKGIEVLNHSSEGRLRPKRLQDLLQNSPGEKDLLAVPQQLGQPLDRGMVRRSLLAQSEGPDGRVHQNSQPRRPRSAL